jgi:hypothetical protein
MRALGETPGEGTSLTFVFDLPRLTDATFGGESVLDHAEDGLVKILRGAMVKGSVDLQGRPPAPDPSWITNLRVSLTVPPETVPRYSFDLFTDENGVFEVGPVDPLTYDMRVKGTHTLQNLVSVTLNPGENLVDAGELLEGDADDNNCVVGLDFSILATTFGKGEGDPGFDPRADFDQNGFVVGLDFSLLATNFGRCGALDPSMRAGTAVVPSAAGSVVMAVVPSLTEVDVGDMFEIVVEIQAGGQLVDSGNAYLNFDPTIMQVEELVSGGVLPIALGSWEFDNTAGTIDFAAGTFSSFPSGTFNLVTVRMTALASSAGSALN